MKDTTVVKPRSFIFSVFMSTGQGLCFAGSFWRLDGLGFRFGGAIGTTYLPAGGEAGGLRPPEL
jgi:hypothetical protein